MTDQPTPQPPREPGHERAKDFVEDAFFERGHPWLKVREIVMILVFWVVLLYPIVILVNSVAPHRIWEGVYRWTYHDGYELVHFLVRAVGIIVIVVVLFTVYLVLRNNHRERKVYPERLTYDVEGQARRKAILEQMYRERFGTEEFRHTARYYVVAPDQNLPTRYVHELLFTQKKGESE